MNTIRLFSKRNYEELQVLIDSYDLEDVKFRLSLFGFSARYHYPLWPSVSQRELWINIPKKRRKIVVEVIEGRLK